MILWGIQVQLGKTNLGFIHSSKSTAPSNRLVEKQFADHKLWLYRLARKLVYDENRAEDLLQQTWLAALKGKNPPQKGKIRAWLTSVLQRQTKKMWQEEFRRLKRERKVAKHEIEFPEEFEPEQAPLLEEIRELTYSLKEPFRSTVLFRFVEDMSHAEIAQIFKVSESLVRMRMTRGLRKIRRKLNRKYKDRKPWCQPS